MEALTLIRDTPTHRKGDVVEVRPDGYWDKRGFRTDTFMVIKFDGKDIKDYADPVYDKDEKMIALRKVNIDVTPFTESKVTADTKLFTDIEATLGRSS